MQNLARLMETLLEDVRFGFRQLMKQRGFAVLAIISMALGIGANTSIFSLVDTALLRPLAVKEPSQLVELYGTLHNGAEWSLQSYLNYKDYRDRNTVFSGLCVYRVVVSGLTVNNSSQRVWGYLVSGNYFDVLGVKPMLGRSFLPEEDQTPDSHPLPLLVTIAGNAASAAIRRSSAKRLSSTATRSLLSASRRKDLLGLRSRTIQKCSFR
jgi:putative ABC transport system permease protein